MKDADSQVPDYGNDFGPCRRSAGCIAPPRFRSGLPPKCSGFSDRPWWPGQSRCVEVDYANLAQRIPKAHRRAPEHDGRLPIYRHECEVRYPPVACRPPVDCGRTTAANPACADVLRPPQQAPACLAGRLQALEASDFSARIFCHSGKQGHQTPPDAARSSNLVATVLRRHAPACMN